MNENQNEYVDINAHDNYPDSKEQINVPTMKVIPLKKICMTIGQLPTAYVETMSYYEMLIWFIEYLKNNIIPTVNNNAEAVQEVQNVVLQLQNYINDYKDSIDSDVEELEEYMNNYFENLDVQEEINNKLDDMLEDGILEQIIEQFLQLTSLICFDNVSAMKSSVNLANGSYARTLGYYNKNEGGSALYKIRTITNNDVVDESFIIALNDNTLIAELIYSTKLDINSCGVYGDNLHDDYTKINYVLNKAKNENISIIFEPKTYLISSPLNVANLFIDFNNATIKVYGNTTIENVINVNSTDYYSTIKNLNIDSTNANVGLDLIQARKCYIENLNITNISNIGIKQTGGYETKITHVNLTGDGTTHCFGIYAYGHDNTYNDVVMIDCYTGIYNRGLNFYNDIHGWLSNADLFYHSCFLNVERGQLLCTNMYCDTYHWCIASESDISEIVVNNLFLTTHEDYATTESSHGEPVALHYSKTNGYNARMINIKNSIILAPTTIGLVWNTDSTGNQINYCGVLEARFPSLAIHYLQDIPCSPVINIPATLTKTNEFTNINMDSIDINWFYKVAEAKNSYSFNLPFSVNECRLPVFKSTQWDSEETIGMAYFNNSSCTITITNGSSSITTSNYLHIIGTLPRIYRNN